MGSSKSKCQKINSNHQIAINRNTQSKFSEEELTDNKNIISVLANEDWKTSSTVPWHDIEKINFEDIKNRVELSQEDVEYILSCCGQYLKELVLSPICDSTIMKTVKKHCHDLELFEFNLKSHNEDDFIEAFSEMRKLKCLVVRTGYILGDRKTPVNLTEILKSLYDGIDEIELITDKSLMWSSNVHTFPSSLERFNSLKSLTLKLFEELDNNAINELSEKKTLVSIEFISCSLKEGTSFILKLPNLERLGLYGMRNIDECLSNLKNYSENIKHVDITSCQEVSVDALRELANLKNLENLIVQRVESVDETFITSLANNSGKILKYLNISRCQGISSNGLKQLEKFENLDHLDIRCVDNLDGNAVIGIANGCKKLTHLCIAGCKNVSEPAFRELNKLENLEILVIVDIDNVKDSVFSKMHKLKVLECGLCRNITDFSMMRIIKNSPNLEFLYAYDTNITTETLICAANETKQRANGVVLELAANREVVERFYKLKKNTGPFLKFDIREKFYSYNNLLNNRILLD